MEESKLITNTEILREIVAYKPEYYMADDLKYALELRFVNGLLYDQIPLTPYTPRFMALLKYECHHFMCYLEEKGWRMY